MIALLLTCAIAGAAVAGALIRERRARRGRLDVRPALRRGR